MNEKVFTTLTLTSVFIFLCVVSYALYSIGKKVNYRFQYQGMVIETIHEKSETGVFEVNRTSGFLNLTDKQRKMFVYVIKSKAPVLMDHDYNRGKSKIVPVSECLMKYYGVCVYETKGEAQKFYYKQIKKNKNIHKWEVKKIKLNTLDRLLSR